MKYPMIVIDKRKVFPVVGLAVAASIVIGLVYQYFAIKQTEAVIARSLTEANQTANGLQGRLVKLNTEEKSLILATELLSLVAISDHGAETILLKEWRDKKQLLSTDLARLTGDLHTLESSRAIPKLTEGNIALDKINDLHVELRDLNSKLQALEESENDVRSKLNALMREEGEYLYEKLRSFSAEMEGMLNEFSAEEGPPPSDLSSTASRTLALRLAQLADLLYTPESLVKKQGRLSKPPSTAEEVRARLSVNQVDRLNLRTTLDAPSPSGAYPRLGSPWRVAALGLNVRTGPSTRANVVCEIYRGEEVRVLRKLGVWWQVSTRCGTGWIVAKHLTSR